MLGLRQEDYVSGECEVNLSNIMKDRKKGEEAMVRGGGAPGGSGGGHYSETWGSSSVSQHVLSFPSQNPGI